MWVRAALFATIAPVGCSTQPTEDPPPGAGPSSDAGTSPSLSTSDGGDARGGAADGGAAGARDAGADQEADAPTVPIPGTGSADEIHWTITGPTSVTFDWRSTSGDRAAALRYGATTAYTTAVSGVTPDPLPFSSSAPYEFFEAKIAGLTPDTVYHYAVGGGDDHTFRTPPAPGTSGFTIFVEGDIGDSSSYAEVTPIQRLIADGKPAFSILVGDLTYGNAHGPSAVDQHFNDVMAWSQDAAYMPAWGNHEYEIDNYEDDFRNYKGRFDFPNPQASPGAPAAGGVGEDWYWFDYGNVRFVAYPEPFSGAWSDWQARAADIMDAAQGDPNIRFIVTAGHRPAYSSGHHPGEPTLASILDALGAGHSKYVLNVCGHSHGYERSTPQSGVTHLVVGTGGASLEEDGSCLWLGGCPAPPYVAFRAMHLGPLKLEFSATGIRGTAVCGPPGGGDNDVTCALGSTMDTFVIGTP